MTAEALIDLSGAGSRTESVTDLLGILARTLTEECTHCGNAAPASTSEVGLYNDPTGAAPWGYRLCRVCGDKVEAGGDARSEVLVGLEQRFLGETSPAGTA